MKIIRQIWFLIILLTLSNIAFGQTSAARLKVDGLKQEVTVRRDFRGIPYIEAKNDNDLYFYINEYILFSSY